jgi:hypothetical protein
MLDRAGEWVRMPGTDEGSLLRFLCLQDIAIGRGLLFFDLHCEGRKFLLRAIAACEMELKQHLSDRLIVISPADPGSSLGLSPLEQAEPDFIQIAEFAQSCALNTAEKTKRPLSQPIPSDP